MSKRARTKYRELIVTLGTIGLLSACSQGAKQNSSAVDNAGKKETASDSARDAALSILNKEGDKNSDADKTTTTENVDPNQSVSSDTSETPDPSKNVDSAKNEVAGSTGTAPETSAPADKPAAEIASANNIPAGQIKINLNELPDNVAICTVGTANITIGDYKRMLKLQQVQITQSLASDPSIRQKLLSAAKTNNITLSGDEKAKILQSARQQKGTSADFKTFLAANKITEQQFNSEILQTGLALKTSNAIIEHGLLPDLVNRELLVQASKAAGLGPTADKKYTEFKNSPEYKFLETQTRIPQKELKDEITKAELAKLQLSKLQEQVKISNADLKKLYDANKAQFKHSERLRISMIVIAAPAKDVGTLKSVRSQLLTANPKLTAKELDTQTARVEEAARQKALIVLGRAQGGENFAKLANESSDNIQARVHKNGGDMGWVEKDKIMPELATAINKLKAGEVMPQVVKSEIGYMVYKVTAKEPAGYSSLAEVKPLLENTAKQGKLQDVANTWLASRKKTVQIAFTPKFINLAKGGSPASQKIGL